MDPPIRSFRLSRRAPFGRSAVDPARLTWSVTLALLAGIVFLHLPLAMLACGPLLQDKHWLVSLGFKWHGPLDTALKNAQIALAVLATEGVIAYVMWRVVRAGQQTATGLPAFTFCWWRGCLLTAAILPGAALLSVWAFGVQDYAWAWGLAPLVLYLLVAPAALSSGLLPTRTNWRPECPECGHTVRYAPVPRCSECGEPYPRTEKFYRRWAIRRMPWERRRRGRFTAYFKTVFGILFRPDRAAWRLASPDGWGRAVRWAIGHALLPVGLGAVIALVTRIAMRTSTIIPDASGIVFADASATSPLWSLQTGIGWTLAAVGLPLCLGLVLAAGAPAVSSAGRSGVVSWSLYASAAPMLVVVVVLVLCALAAASAALAATGPAVPLPWVVAILWFGGLQSYAVMGLFALYGVWWAIGVASQPYAQRRGFMVFTVALLAYLTVWRACLSLFDLRGFEGLL